MGFNFILFQQENVSNETVIESISQRNFKVEVPLHFDQSFKWESNDIKEPTTLSTDTSKQHINSMSPAIPSLLSIPTIKPLDIVVDPTFDTQPVVLDPCKYNNKNFILNNLPAIYFSV